jgi:membrane fusion protein (multidrug efflux system)
MTFHRAMSLVPALLLCGIISCKKEAPAPILPEVTVRAAEVRDVPIQVEFTGEVRGGEDVEVRARVAGFLQQVAYQEGTQVKKGQLLFVIDPKEYEAAASRARAQLAEARAKHSRAKVQVDRLRPLAAQNAVSQQDLDNAVASEQATRADVDATSAALRTAELNLGYTQVKSPIDGVAGKRQADVGAFVGSPDPTVLTTVSQMDPIRVNFTISESEYLSYVRSPERAARQGRPLDGLELVLSDGSVHNHKGVVSVVDRGIDQSTGTLPIQATFPNPERLVRPGQFGRVRLPLMTRKGAMLVPQRAVQDVQGSYSVFVVGADSTVRSKPIRVGARVGSDWVVMEGLTPEDRVVVEGVQKVRAGVKVRATNAPAAADTTKPAPGTGAAPDSAAH